MESFHLGPSPMGNAAITSQLTWSFVCFLIKRELACMA